MIFFNTKSVGQIRCVDVWFSLPMEAQRFQHIQKESWSGKSQLFPISGTPGACQRFCQEAKVDVGVGEGGTE